MTRLIEEKVALLDELHDKNKSTAKHLSSDGTDFCWGGTPRDIHQECISKLAVNDTSEIAFGYLTVQIQSFGHMGL